MISKRLHVGLIFETILMLPFVYNLRESVLSQNLVERVCELYFESLNANNLTGVTEALHFPHFRVMADGHVEVWNNSTDLWDWFKKRTSDDGWHHSTFDSVKPEQLTEKKFHVEVRFGRYREDKSLIGKYRSLYIVTFEKDKWGIKAGSGTG